MAEPINLPTDHDGDGIPGKLPGASKFSPATLPSPGLPADDDAILQSPSPDARSWLDGGWALLDGEGRIVRINDDLAGWFHCSAAELSGSNLWDLLTRRCAGWEPAISRLRAGAEAEVFAEVKLARAGDPGRATEWFSLELARCGASCCLRASSILPPLSDLEEGAWDESLRTVAAQRQLFVRLLRAEAQLKTLTDQWPGVVFGQRSDLSFRFVSAKIEELTGVPAADWQARPHLFWEVVHEGDAEEVRNHFKLARQSGQPVTLTYRIRHAHTGRIAYVLEHRQANMSRGGLLMGYEGVWLDVTRQTIAEKRLSSAAWKETLSVLTMGLAHDFSNVMAGIHALSETFLDQDGARQEFNDGLILIRKNAQQASHLVHRIINLHQGKTGERSYYNLNEVAAELAELIRKAVPRRMQFAVEISPEPLPVYLDEIELRQVVLNLVLNAVDAMPEGGRLVLRTTAFRELPPMTHRQGDVPRVPAACLSIQDTGRGIQSRHLSSLFDPFFTTKPVNKGSGLGLYNARLFAEKHRGAVSVDSTEGVGSTFHLWMPQADFTEAEAEARAKEPPPAAGPREPRSF